MIGESVGNFVVIRKLGQGGMGEVLLAEHREIKTKVAIKMLLPHISADKQHVQRFFNEAVAVSKIKHSGIARIFDVGFHQNGAYLVMEYLEGESLGGRISRLGRLPYEQVFDIARQIASVLEATHAAGITHRDLKPDNIFLVPDAELASGERVKVLDFGIAKLASSNMTQSNGAMGTPLYMSPEQWMSSAKVDGRADVYSLGCIAFEMACGHPPFASESVGVLCTMHLTEDAPRISSVVPDVPAAFDAFVARLLVKPAHERPTVRETKDAFSQFAIEYAASGVAPAAPRVPVQRWDTPTEGIVASAKPTTLGSSAMQLVTTPPAPRSKWIALAGMGVLAVAGVTLAIVAAGGDGDKPRAAAQAPSADVATAPALATAPAAGATATAGATPPPGAATPPSVPPAPNSPADPATSLLHIETVPATAQVTIDDAAVPNPFDGKFQRSDVRHRIDVRAAGYKPDSRWITFDANHSLTVTLEKLADAPVAKTTTKKTTTAATKPDVTPKTPAAPDVAAKTPEPAKPVPTPAKTPATDTSNPTYRGSKATINTQFPTD